MNNFKHGFDSRNHDINTDSLMMNSDVSRLTSEELSLVENYLLGSKTGSNNLDVIKAHNIAKLIYQYGRFSQSCLFPKAEAYVQSYEYETMEKIAQLENINNNQ